MGLLRKTIRNDLPACGKRKALRGLRNKPGDDLIRHGLRPRHLPLEGGKS